MVPTVSNSRLVSAIFSNHSGRSLRSFAWNIGCQARCIVGGRTTDIGGSPRLWQVSARREFLVQQGRATNTPRRSERNSHAEDGKRVSTRTSHSLLIQRKTDVPSRRRQSQTINPEFLSKTPHNARFTRKADYAFSFNRNAPHVSGLYGKLNRAGISISHTTDASTKRLALFSGIEVKPENGGKDEALVQLATWLSAGLENVKTLGSASREEPFSSEELLPMLGWTVIGHDWHTYIAFRTARDGTETTVRYLFEIALVQSTNGVSVRCWALEDGCRYEGRAWCFQTYRIADESGEICKRGLLALAAEGGLGSAR